MANLSPKIEIINHFDNLIQQIDIDIDQSIERYKENQVLGELKIFKVEYRNSRKYNLVNIEYFDTNESSQNNKSESVIEWSESTKVIDYLTQVRQRTINELRKAQEDGLEYLKSKSCDLDQIKQSKDVDEMKSRLFSDKFYFQVFYKPKYQESWVFSLFTIVVDFYLPPSDISLIELLINEDETEIEKIYSDFGLIFDEKSCLIHSIVEGLFKKLKTQQFPNHLISFCKQDLLSNIKDIRIQLKNRKIDFNCSPYYSSKLESLDITCIGAISYLYHYLERVKIEGISSLKSLSLKLESLEGNSFGNLNSLKHLNLDVKSEINNDMLIKLLEICPNVEKLCLNGSFSNINFDSFTNLKKLRLFGNLLNDFNFDLFKNVCIQLEELWIGFNNIDDESISKLLFGNNFPKVSNFSICNSKITRFEKKLFDGFPMIQLLNVSHNDELKTINNDVFSNLKNLKELELSFNQLWSVLDPELFSDLKNLEKFSFSSMKMIYFDLKIMDYIVNIKEIKLFGYFIENKESTLKRFEQLNIKFDLDSFDD